MTDITNLKSWIKQCEGFNDHPYLDTVGKVTIGWGRNLDDRGISVDEAELMLTNDINLCHEELLNYIWYQIQPEPVKWALINMCFNMGLSKLLSFKKMIAALCHKDYTTAAQEALNSKWALQVGQRAKDVAVMIREGYGT